MLGALAGSFVLDEFYTFWALEVLVGHAEAVLQRLELPYRAVTLCTGGPPVFNGIQQNVFSPSGNFSAVVHNSDIPILVFDVSAAESEADFIAKCAAGEIVPLATGTAKQRPIIHETNSAFGVKVKTRGVVTDATGQDWTMQSFINIREVFGAEEPQVFNEWVTLKAL